MTLLISTKRAGSLPLEPRMCRLPGTSQGLVFQALICRTNTLGCVSKLGSAQNGRLAAVSVQTQRCKGGSYAFNIGQSQMANPVRPQVLPDRGTSTSSSSSVVSLPQKFRKATVDALNITSRKQQKQPLYPLYLLMVLFLPWFCGWMVGLTAAP